MKKLIIPKQTVAKEDIKEDLTGTPPVDIQAPPASSEDGVNQEEFDPELLAAVEPETEDVIDIDPNSAEVALEEMQQEIVEELYENDKVADIAENLNDIADTVEASPSSDLTDSEKQLIACSANMAVSGTDDDAAEIAPSLESFKDKALVIADLRKKHQIATESILDSIQNVFTKFSEFVKSLFTFSARIEYRLKNSKKDLSNLKSSNKEKIELKFRKTSILKKNITEYVENLEEYKKCLTDTVDFFGKFAPLAEKSVSSFTGSIWKFWTTLPGTEKNFESASELYDSYINNFVVATTKLPGMIKVDSIVPHIEEYRSEALLGGTYVHVQKYKDIAKIDEENVVEMKNTISNSAVVFTKRSEFIKSKNEDEKNTVMFEASIKDLEDIISQAEKALSIYKLFLNQSYKSFAKSAAIRGIKGEYNGKLMGLHTFILNRGINNASVFISYAKLYSQILCLSPLGVVDRFTSSSKWNRE